MDFLEARSYLSASAPAAVVQPLNVGGSSPVNHLGLTLADRQQLLSHLSGDLANALSKNLRHSGVDAFDRTLLDHMVYRPGPFYLFNTKKLGTYVKYVGDTIPGIADAVVARATDILGHRFPEQSNSRSYDVKLPPRIDWDTTPDEVTNSAFVYSLNDFTFWKKLSVAFRYKGDGRYAQEVVDQLTTWSAQTPAPAAADVDHASVTDPQWQTLTTALRANNWIYAYFMLLGSEQWTPAANTLFLKKLWEHGDFLDRVTPSSYRKNRTATQASGLLRVAIMFPEFKESANWEKHGSDMTFKTLAAQFHPDGGHVE